MVVGRMRGRRGTSGNKTEWFLEANAMLLFSFDPTNARDEGLKFINSLMPCGWLILKSFQRSMCLCEQVWEDGCQADESGQKRPKVRLEVRGTTGCLSICFLRQAASAINLDAFASKMRKIMTTCLYRKCLVTQTHINPTRQRGTIQAMANGN